MNYRDQLNRPVNIPHLPERIISLVPSQTELLYDLGLRNRLIAQTIFCIHPETEFPGVNKIGGTKKLNIQKIISLNPDLIIANKEENEKGQIEELECQFPVWISDVDTFEDALDMIRCLGEITQTTGRASEIIEAILKNRNAFLKESFEKQSVVYLIWKSPYIAVGTSTFINTMLSEAGFENLIDTNRYPEISIEDIKKLNPDWVFLSTEPFPFKEEHKKELEKTLGKNKCLIVDGEMFSWYGSRLIKAYDYFGWLRNLLST